MPKQFNVSERRLLAIVLEHENDDEDDRAGIDELLAGVDALTSGWLLPFGVALQFVHCDPANAFEEVGAPARAHRSFRVARLHPEVRAGPPLFDSHVSRLPSLDAAVIRDEVVRELEQPAPTGLITSLSQMWWTSVRALSPLDEEIELATPYPTTALTESIDGARWCFGPVTRGNVAAPAWLRANNSHVAIKILLEIYWDLWCDYPPGRALVDAGVSRVLARGGWTGLQLHPPA
jgi:hypothetical protein